MEHSSQQDQLRNYEVDQQLISAELEAQTTAVRYDHDEVMAEIRNELERYITL